MSSMKKTDDGKHVPKKEENEDDENGGDEKKPLLPMSSTAFVVCGDAQVQANPNGIHIQIGADGHSFVHPAQRVAKLRRKSKSISKIQIEGLQKQVLMMNGMIGVGAASNLMLTFVDPIQEARFMLELGAQGYQLQPF